MAIPKDNVKAVRLYLRVLSQQGAARLQIPTANELSDLELQLRQIDGVETLRIVQQLGESGAIKW